MRAVYGKDVFPDALITTRLPIGGRGDGAAMAGNNNNAHAKMKKEEEKKKENTLVVFDALGGDFTKVRLVRSHTRASTTPVLVDEVDSPASCLSS